MYILPVPVPIVNSQKQQPSYWKADYNKVTKNVDIGAPITQAQAIARVANNQSIMCTNYKKAMQVAFIFPSPKLEINVGKYVTSDFYPHFHIRGGHGAPHIWFYPSRN